MIGLLAALFLAAQPVESAATPPPPEASEIQTPPKPPANIENAVDANGVPAWAKRKRLAPVQNCTGRPNIGVDTWRAELDPTSKTGARRNVPVKVTCKH
ncbi:hypothetical protein [uncultured Phenylobacterium sp.]|uniref:hypothetical protein n=1 Tax=uncultured Phenylobacterium sp. TaxID=349273 RepID=UPI0025F59868|nr:hypothetical protein [uncultured Phenylobacterium sp.]